MFAAFTLGTTMPHGRVRTPVEQLQPFERGRIVGLWEAGWTYRRTAAHAGHNVSVVSRCFQQWSVEHSHTHRPGSERLRRTDAHQTRLCASSSGRRNRILGRNPGTCCTCCVTEDHWKPSVCSRTQITCASGQATTSTTTAPSFATLVS